MQQQKKPIKLSLYRNSAMMGAFPSSCSKAAADIYLSVVHMSGRNALPAIIYPDHMFCLFLTSHVLTQQHSVLCIDVFAII